MAAMSEPIHVVHSPPSLLTTVLRLSPSTQTTLLGSAQANAGWDDGAPRSYVCRRYELSLTGAFLALGRQQQAGKRKTLLKPCHRNW